MTEPENRAMGRRVVWFSCGAPSAVAAMLTVTTYPEAEVVYTRVEEEHPDNMRFLSDCEDWLNHPIRSIGNESYGCSIYRVFQRERFLVGRNGAPCTRLLKRKVREQFQRHDDIHVMGYTYEERDRLEDFREHFPELNVECPLVERGLSREDCLAMILDAGIELPMMYRLGYNNNNCRGCVKGGAGYWNKIRLDFPEYFLRMSQMERRLGHALIRINGTPTFLDELPPDYGRDVPEPRIDCSIMCLLAKQEYTS